MPWTPPRSASPSVPTASVPASSATSAPDSAPGSATSPDGASGTSPDGASGTARPPRRGLAMILAAGAGMASVTAITAAEVMPTPDALAAGHHTAAPGSAVSPSTGSRGHRSATRRFRRNRNPGPAAVQPATVHIESVSAPVLVSQAELQQSAGGSPPPESLSAPSGAAPDGATPPAGAASASSGTAAPPASPTSAAPSAAPAAPPAASGGSPGGTDLGMFTVTCYAIHGRTATGDEAGTQSAAVDPSVIPLGSHIWVEGVGYRTADDTGGAIRGHHIDIWESTTSACSQFGRQYLDVRMAS